MSLPDKLLEKLVCPQCKGKLIYNDGEEKLICEGCKLAFRVTDSVPVLLVDEAEKI